MNRKKSSGCFWGQLLLWNNCRQCISDSARISNLSLWRPRKYGMLNKNYRAANSHVRMKQICFRREKVNRFINLIINLCLSAIFRFNVFPSPDSIINVVSLHCLVLNLQVTFQRGSNSQCWHSFESFTFTLSKTFLTTLPLPLSPPQVHCLMYFSLDNIELI